MAAIRQNKITALVSVSADAGDKALFSGGSMEAFALTAARPLSGKFGMVAIQCKNIREMMQLNIKNIAMKYQKYRNKIAEIFA